MSKLVVLPTPIAPMPAGATIVVDELVLLDGYQTLPTCLLRISTTNRKRFNLDALERLAANVKEVGILQPILIRFVMPTEEHPQPFEIVAGERRFRSAILAELSEVPVIIRQLSNLQAAEIQLLENIQREDPHPLEEAEGYQLLMQNHGYDADKLAERVKKSRAYIYGRLKLCALSLDVREVFLDGDIPASTALLIARIPTPQLQTKALQEILKPQWGSEPLSYRAAASHIASRYTLDLAGAPFDIKDSKLLTTVSNCKKCPKRTGNQPELYPDATSADVCTDPDCFAEKKVAHYQRIVVIANKKGIPVLEREEANEILEHDWSREAEFVTIDHHLSAFDRVAPTTGMAGTLRKNLSAEDIPAPAKYVKSSNGSVDPIYRRTDIQTALEKAGACESESTRAARVAAEAADPSQVAAATKQRQKAEAAEKAHKAKVARADSVSRERLTLYKKLRAHAGTQGMSIHMLRELAKAMVYTLPLPHDLLTELYPFDDGDDAACAYIDNADGPTIMLLIMDLIVGESLSVSYWDVDNEPDGPFAAVLAMARLESIEATAADIAIAQIDLAELNNPSDVYEVIAANIEHLADVARHIVDKAPHHTGNVEAAANKLGYFYNNGWSKADDAAGADQLQADVAAQPATDNAAGADQLQADVAAQPVTDDAAGADQLQADVAAQPATDDAAGADQLQADVAAQPATDDAAGADQMQTDAAAQQGSPQRPKLQAKAKPAAEAAPNGPVIKTKKNRSASLASNPAVAWPFPTDSRQKM